jgi:methyltransferase FkbM-like protein
MTLELFASEYGEDRALFRMFEPFFLQPRFYADIGCGHPVINSNTHFLRSLGWKGLHVDGNPEWASEWPAGWFINRVVSIHSHVHFDPHPVKELSRIGEGFPNTETVLLQTLLDQHLVDKIGLLSVDAEGHEYEVIRSMNLKRHQPQFIISEFNTAGIGEDYRVRDYLCDNGYEVIYQTVANLCYHYAGCTTN